DSQSVGGSDRSHGQFPGADSFQVLTAALLTERHRSPAAAAGEMLNSEKPSCRRGQVQRLVRTYLSFFCVPSRSIAFCCPSSGSPKIATPNVIPRAPSTST